MNDLFNDLEYDWTYIDDLLEISNKSFEEHINKLDKVLYKLKQKGFKVNLENDIFASKKLDNE